MTLSIIMSFIDLKFITTPIRSSHKKSRMGYHAKSFLEVLGKEDCSFHVALFAWILNTHVNIQRN